jgi:hypothetical protein
LRNVKLISGEITYLFWKPSYNYLCDNTKSKDSIVDISKVKKSEDWGFEMPSQLVDEIDRFILLLENGNEIVADLSTEGIRSSARDLKMTKQRNEIWDYYYYGEWRDDVN